MNKRKNRHAPGRVPENRPVVIWNRPAPRGNASRTGKAAPNVIPFPGPRSEREEAAVTEWTIPARPGRRPAKIVVISSGFGIPADRNPQNRCMAA